MKRYKLKNKKRFYTIITLVTFVISLGFITAFYHPKAEGQTLSSYKTITVDYGDTIWDIAQRYKNNSILDMRMFIYNIEKTNGLKGELILPGQVLRIPQGE